jgi:hypothetical protein
MSHVSTYKMRVVELDILKAVLEEKGIEYKENCVVTMYGTNKVNAAVAFKLPGWRYECAVKADGEILFDHFGSESNSFERLGETVKAYNISAVKAEAWGIDNLQNVWEQEIKGATQVILEF